MKVCIVHVDDESDEPRQVSERIALDGLPHFFSRPIQNALFFAAEGGFGDATITWQHDTESFQIDYLKCTTAEEVSDASIAEYDDVAFVFDVHKDNEYGTGKLLTDSIRHATQILAGKPLKAFIWTNFPNSDAVRNSGLKVRLKRDVGDFAIELMALVGFEVHE